MIHLVQHDEILLDELELEHDDHDFDDLKICLDEVDLDDLLNLHDLNLI
jgi:hypothetical protein